MVVPRDTDTPTFSDAALIDLRRAFEQHCGDVADIGDLRAPLRRFLNRARDEKLPPEKVLVHLKHALDGLEAFRDDVPRDGASLRSRVVSLAIEVYYADGESRV